MVVDSIVKFQAITQGPKQHWFGYYDKCPWSNDGRFILVMEADFGQRAPRSDDYIRLGKIDMKSDNYQIEFFAETNAWCWQSGCMLQWLPSSSRKVIYNKRDGNLFVSVTHDLITGEIQKLPLPIFCVTPDGKKALTINFSRLAKYRPGYGYAGVADAFEDDLRPQKDGIWSMDLITGSHQLILSLAQIAEIDPIPEMEGVAHRFNHVQINRNGTRFGVLHRFMRQNRSGDLTRLLTANMDGSDICMLNPNRFSSHYDWRDDRTILIWAREPNSPIDENPRNGYLLFTDKTKKFIRVGEFLFSGDGHCSYSPDTKWVLTDTYPNRKDNMQTLILYHPESNRRIEIGRFYHSADYIGEYRCDLHPRWNREGSHICFDSVFKGTRQLYVIDVRELMK